MSTPIVINGTKIYGTDVTHGLKYLQGIRPKELDEMLRDAKKSNAFYFPAHIPGKGKQHYALIHEGSGEYKLVWKGAGH